VKSVLGLGFALAIGLAGTAHAETKIKFTLDWKLQGVHAWYYLAKEKGYFKAEGLDVQIDQGEGSAATVTRIISGAYDAGFGDMNAIIQNAASKPESAPVMVYQIYNQPPFAVLTRADGPVKTLKDLEGRNVGAPPGSASTRLFPALASAAGFDASTVKITNITPNLQEQMLIQKQVDASLVFNVTSYMNILGQKLDPDKDFRWFPYGASGLDIYSNGVMVSRTLYEKNPKAVEGLVRAINKAVLEVIADPSEGMKILKSVEPLIKADLEEKRMKFALDNLISSEESKANGIGAVDMARLGRSIEVIKSLYDLKATPKAEAVFSPKFLPPAAERKL